MAIRYDRGQCLARLRAEIARGNGLVMTGAGNGIAAKFIERGGVDLIGVYNTGYFRMQGYGSLAGMLPIFDANELVLHTVEREVLPQVRATPVVAGVNGVDPLRDMPRFVETLRAIGVSGVHNFPTVGWFDGEFRRTLEATGLGYGHEIAMLNAARELEMLTVGYAFNADDTRRLMDEAQPDIFIFHAGITSGGATGDGGAATIEDTAARSKAHFDVARASSQTSSCSRTARRSSTPSTRRICSTTPDATACSSDRASSAWRSKVQSSRERRPSRPCACLAAPD